MSKNPINENKDVSLFNINGKISKPGQSETYDVTSGYRYNIINTSERTDIKAESLLFVPPNVHYNKQITTTLNINVNKSSIKTLDTITGESIHLSENVISAAFDHHINQSISESFNLTVDNSIQYTDVIDIDGGEEETTYEVLWSETIAQITIEMGEIVFSFEVPKNKSFYGYRVYKGNEIIKVDHSPLFDTLAIALTRKCSAACEMCCFACSPDCTEELDAALVLRIIEEAAQLPEIKKIGFTGGEATLRKDLLLKCIKRTKMHGMKATLTSNGSWAHSPDAARKWLLDFKNTGLDLLTISVDEYHQQYIPLDHIRNIIRANKDIGLMIMLAIGDSLEKRDAFALINELREDLYEVPVTVYPFIAVGRGETLTHTVQKAVDPQWRCHNQRILSILYDGSVYPCCSQAVYESLLCEGNIKNTTLKEIIEKYQYFSVFSEFSCHDFKWLLQKAKEYQIEVNKTTQSPCSFCHELFSNPMFVDKLREEIIRKRSITMFEKLAEMNEENKSLSS